MVRRLLRLRDAVTARESADELAADIGQARDDAMVAVDEYFKRALTAVPAIEAYLDEVATRGT
jgi:hypothetical protein